MGREVGWRHIIRCLGAWVRPALEPQFAKLAPVPILLIEPELIAACLQSFWGNITLGESSRA